MPHRRYRLMRLLGVGGMAQVYEAVLEGERGFERRIAIKRVLPDLGADTRRMFIDEARIASALHHGNIVQVVDYGTIDDTEFIAMEFVDGLDAGRATKRALERGSPMDEGLALHIVSEIAHALAYAHGHTDSRGRPMRIVHRDVSPHNILLSFAGDVKLADFGIAFAAEREAKTVTGYVKGKVRYMPPEQALGRDVHGAADIYALGASLHALIVGQPPGTGLETLSERMHGGSLVLDPVLSADVAALVRRCMTMEADARPSARDVAQEASALARKRLDSDGRGTLAHWLGPLTEGGPKHSPLDEIGDVCIVPRNVGDRQFTVSKGPAEDIAGEGAADTLPDARSPEQAIPQTVPSGPGPDTVTLPPEAGGTADPPAPSEQVPSEPQIAEADTAPLHPVDGNHAAAAMSGEARASSPSAGSRGLLVALGAVTLVGAGAGLWTAYSKTSADRGGTTVALDAGQAFPPSASDTEPDRDPDAGLLGSHEQVAFVGVDDRGGAPGELTSDDVLSPESLAPPREKSIRGSQGRGSRMVETAVGSTTMEATASLARAGWLRVGGAAVAGARVVVDGRPRGYAPLDLRLPLGEHRVSVLSLDGNDTLVRRRVRIEEGHTRSSPARIIQR